MSNNRAYETYENQARVIQIKPIKKDVKRRKNPKQSSKENKTILANQIQAYEDELLALEKRRDQLLLETENEVVNLRKAWEEEKTKLIKQAHEEGYQDGFTLGKKESLEQYNELINHANEIIHQATNDYHHTVESSEEMIIKLAVHTAGKILEQKIIDQPESFIPIVRTAINEIKDQLKITLYVHPNKYELVLQQKDELVEALDGDTQLSIYVDQDIKENDCIIEHPFGQIDASIDTQLMQIREALQEFIMENGQ